ncbi:YcaO-like family protein [Natronosalvus halobius]|uniref:YcaO-like family protein n=1 Tax=Natronosalvus halobius TaxID=2953746 RepID=UPI0020A08F54|nr:YcaO-like family protein [Natronosalvus halobius]USZ72708.1 YcaO-like family protein [Natronosalvus halobius]
MDVHVVGDDPVRAAVVAAFDDVDSVSAVDATPDDLSDARFAIVSDVVGAETFEHANAAAREGNTPWIAVEVGGVGSQPIQAVDAAISGFAADTACFSCLEARVESTLQDEDVGDGRPRANRSAARLAGAIAGRECIRLFSGAEPTIIGQVREVPHARRRLLPVPGCACEPSERDRSLDLGDDESLDLEAAVDRAELAIDDRVGIVESIGELESFPVPYYLATVADTTAYSDASAPTQAAGVAVDWNEALMKAVGEGLERYCAGIYRDADFVRASETALENAVSPTDLVRPDSSPEYDPDEDRRWVEGVALESRESTHLPAAAVQFPQPGDSLVPSITTGLGLGSSTVDALRSGLTEVVERDATMLAWYSTFEPSALEVEAEAEVYETLARRARSEGLETTALLCSQDVDVPVVAVAVHRDLDTPTEEYGDPWPHFAVGSAAGLDVDAAATSALGEALQNWTELRGMGPEEAENASGAIGEYGSFPDRARKFVDVGDAQRVSASSVSPDPVPTGAARLEALLERVTDAGLTPYAARLTTRDVERIGFEAVRVVVPEAQPLFTGEPYFAPRAETVPDELGFEPRLERAFHPYP